MYTQLYGLHRTLQCVVDPFSQLCSHILVAINVIFTICLHFTYAGIAAVVVDTLLVEIEC